MNIKTKAIKKITSVILSAILAVSMLSAGSINTYADEETSSLYFETSNAMTAQDTSAWTKTNHLIQTDSGCYLKLEFVSDEWGLTDDYWTKTFTLTNLKYTPNKDETITDFSELPLFKNASDMILFYPDDTYERIPWKNGKADYDNSERYLNVLKSNVDAGTVDLKPGDQIIGAFKETITDDINITFNGNEDTVYTGEHTGDLSDGIWCETDTGYYVKIYTTDTTGNYRYTLVDEGWGTPTGARVNWNHELKMDTYNKKVIL